MNESAAAPAGPVEVTARRLLNKVPEITVFFWIIKVLCTTVGETASDFLNVNLNFGLTGTSIVTGILLAIALVLQFRSKRYVPALYWTNVVLVSVFGTLVTDNLTDGLGVPLETSTIVFSVLLALTFGIWYANERTLAIHTIFTRRREAFYWLAILFTFALGTAAGDLMAESLGLGYSTTGLIIVAVVAAIALAWKIGMDPVLSFWIIYVMTRPLGASLGDYLSQPPKYGGLGLGATVTSAIFLTAIAATVAYLAVTRRDVIKSAAIVEEEKEIERHGEAWQVAIAIGLLIALSAVGYAWRRSYLDKATAAPENSAAVSTSSTAVGAQAPSVFPASDLSDFKTIASDALDLVNAGKLADAKTRIADLEHDWDAAQARLKPMDQAKWTEMDGAVDKVLRQLRAVNPDASGCRSSLEALLGVIVADSQPAS